ncbi:Techylectin-5A [Araneus ventricosus]|uniref:Techylectin-5A n=1 Tax=Araneus ventricosus TaxID=182803 RepID=A0A4Y2JT64_ARAVE|nr:Techylectin-5A [Araneus ventricosus]
MVPKHSLYLPSPAFLKNMWIGNTFFKLLFLVLFAVIEAQADSSACEQKEKHLALLDLAKESISKAKDLQPACINDPKDISSNSSECGAKEKVSAYLDIARNLIEEAKSNFSTCDEGRNLRRKPADCAEVLENGDSRSGEYTIWPRHRIDGMQLRVYCDMETDGGGWTVIQRRGNFSKKVDFYRTWSDYKHGFGNISEEFWIGNDIIFALTNQGNYTARFDMENVDEEYRFATYSSFRIEDENAGYALHFGNYNGTAGDGIETMNNMQFSTRDKQYEESNKECPFRKFGGWWYRKCGWSNPNGLNIPGGKQDEKYMNWYPFTNYDSLLSIKIMIRSEN